MAQNTVEFIYKLTDRISAPLQKAQETFRKVHEQTKKVDDGIKKLPLSIADLRSEMTVLERKKTFATTEAEIKRVNTVIQKTQKELQRLENLPPKSFINRLREIPKALIGVSLGDLGIVYATRMAMRFTKESAKLYDVQAKAEAQLKSTLEATGYAAGRTFSQLTKQASDLQKKTLFGDEATIQAQSVLLTFKQVRGEVYDKAIPAIADLATHLKTDLQSATLQIGKALQDPILGITTLRRSGIQFSDEQEAAIKKLVEVGKMQEAQMIIINELYTQFGGSAEAAAKTALGPLQQLSNMWGDLREKLGGFILRNVNELVPTLRKMLEWTDKNSTAIKNFGKVLSIGAVGFISFKVATSGAVAGLRFFRAQASLTHLSTSLLTGGVKALTAAWIALKTVQKATVIGAIISIVMTAATAFMAFRRRVKEVKDELSTVNKMAAEYAADEKVRLDGIFEKLRRANPESAERNRLIKELKEMYPGLLDNMALEKGGLQDLEAAYHKIIEAIDKKAQMQAAEDRLVELYKRKGELDEILKKGGFNIPETKEYIKERNDVERSILTLKNDRANRDFEESYTVFGAKLAKEREALQFAIDNFYKHGGSTYFDTNGDIKDIDLDWMYNRISEINKKLETEKKPNNATINPDPGPDPDPDKVINGLTSGGSKATHINITFRNLIEFLNMYPQTFKEGVDEARDELTEGLLRVVNSANRVGQ